MLELAVNIHSFSPTCWVVFAVTAFFMLSRRLDHRTIAAGSAPCGRKEVGTAPRLREDRQLQNAMLEGALEERGGRGGLPWDRASSTARQNIFVDEGSSYLLGIDKSI